MECIYCGSPDTKVTDTAKNGKRTLRERTCQSCGKWFCTEETAADISRQYILKNELKAVRRLNSAKASMAGSNAR